MVWKEGVLIKDFPAEAFTIKCLDDSWSLLKQEDGQKRFEEYLRQWMKKIQELLLESEQLRLETDDAGPQAELEPPKLVPDVVADALFSYVIKTQTNGGI